MAKQCVICGESPTTDSRVGTMKDVINGRADFVDTNVGSVCSRHVMLYRSMVEEALCEVLRGETGLLVPNPKFVNKRVGALLVECGQ